jgi:hypothetical protein
MPSVSQERGGSGPLASGVLVVGPDLANNHVTRADRPFPFSYRSGTMQAGLIRSGIASLMLRVNLPPIRRVRSKPIAWRASAGHGLHGLGARALLRSFKNSHLVSGLAQCSPSQVSSHLPPFGGQRSRESVRLHRPTFQGDRHARIEMRPP